jgi:hypothetical protein
LLVVDTDSDLLAIRWSVTPAVVLFDQKAVDVDAFHAPEVHDDFLLHPGRIAAERTHAA